MGTMESFWVALHADHEDTSVHVNNTGLEERHLHACLAWRSVSLVEVASTASAHKVVSCWISTMRERNDMVDVNIPRTAKRSLPPAAVDARLAIARHDVPLLGVDYSPFTFTGHDWPPFHSATHRRRGTVPITMAALINQLHNQMAHRYRTDYAVRG